MTVVAGLAQSGEYDFNQTVVRAEARRVARAPTIDGRLDEAFGTTPVKADGFTQYFPNPGRPSSQETKVWIGYDDRNLYVVARLLDTAAGKIEAQLTQRDRLGNTDWFGVAISPYRDGINASTFIVTPAGVQFDARFTAASRTGGQSIMVDGDRAWNAVWEAAATRDEGGWTAEMRIPYSALRFPEADVQTWDINFGRSIRRLREESHWRAVDPEVPGFVTQMGVLEGIRNVTPPVRLQATPFVTATATHSSDPTREVPNEFGNALGGGLDVKYGLSDAFTLDMTLVPDFSNARSDNQVLNLNANEVRFSENRDFFTEGVELFNKGGFFYSRRIGATPLDRGRVDDLLREGEEVVENPVTTQLLNATKVTGRTERGLGIGVLNAVEGETVALVGVPDGDARREIVTSPITNYSVVSLDQNLPNNSFVTLLNTTVLRSGSTYDANLTGTVFDLRNADNSWRLSGKAALSQQYSAEGADVGHTYELSLDKLTGRLRYGGGFTVESDDYDPTDLGFLYFNNERSAEVYASYNWFEPFGMFNNARVRGSLGISYLYEPFAYANSYFSYGSRMTTRSFLSFGVNGFTELAGERDYQDTRTPGRYIQYPAFTRVGAWVSTDYRKPFAFNLDGAYGGTYTKGDNASGYYRVSIGPRYRFGDQLTVRFDVGASQSDDGYGYVGHSAASAKTYRLDDFGTNYSFLNDASLGYDRLLSDVIVVGYRDVRTVELELGLDYAFRAQMTLSARARHYWSNVKYSAFAELGIDGDPVPTDYLGADDAGSPLHDQNFNAFNVDVFYTWRYAPGSDLLISYKTVSFFDGEPDGSYLDNLGTLGQERVDNSITLKAIYWLDYDAIRRGG